jgi:hypothetical protein
LAPPPPAPLHGIIPAEKQLGLLPLIIQGIASHKTISLPESGIRNQESGLIRVNDGMVYNRGMLR